MNNPDSVSVSFIPDNDILDVQPQIHKNVRDSVWIRLYGKSATDKEIIERAVKKLELGYGLSAHDYKVYR
jgi:hypothetical protein